MSENTSEKSSKIKIEMSTALSSTYDKRYVVVAEETGEVLDDTQGYGYKSRQKAAAAWNYKHRDRSKEIERKRKRRVIKDWMKENAEFVNLMDDIAFEIAKGSWGPDDKFNAKLVKQLLKDNNVVLGDFTVGDLLRVWRSRRD